MWFSILFPTCSGTWRTRSGGFCPGSTCCQTQLCAPQLRCQGRPYPESHPRAQRPCTLPLFQWGQRAGALWGRHWSENLTSGFIALGRASLNFYINVRSTPLQVKTPHLKSYYFSQPYHRDTKSVSWETGSWIFLLERRQISLQLISPTLGNSHQNNG